ncbi:ankyrin repeat-containing domain protein [Aspergillus undulatus]|uniref:ankyrin repeat-containing domain protein n=1 Tax=Aspergillus undulatus TaxID=1810928 RepID=UPI003CCD799E
MLNESTSSEHKQTNKGLLSFPDELLLLIGKELSFRSLNAFIQTSKRFYFALTSQLYDTLLEENRRTLRLTDVIVFAARTGNLKTLEKILTRVTPQESLIKPDSLIALEAAAENGHAHVLQFLFELGFSCKPDAMRRLVLSAARGNHVKAMEALIDTGADILSPCSLSDCPLTAAAFAYQGDPSTVNLLCERSAYKDARGDEDETVLHHLARSGDFDMLQFFLNLGSPVDAKDTRRQTPLFNAVKFVHHSAVLLLLSRGANASISDGTQTPLHLAVISNHPSVPAIVQLLLDHGADVNARSRANNTPLHLATSTHGGNENTVKILLQAGADCHAIIDEKNQYTPLLNAMRTGYSPTISLLIGAGGIESPKQSTKALVWLAVHHNLFELLKKVVVDRFDPELQKFLEEQPLHEAVRPGRDEILAFILTKITNVNWKDSSGDTAFLKAAKWGATVETLRILLEHGADVNDANRYGCTALMNAAGSSSIDVTAFILERTAQPDALDITRQSALDYAVQGSQDDNVELLLKHGMVSMRENILEFAIHRGNPLIVSSLLNYSVSLLHYPVRGNVENQDGGTPLIKACTEGIHAIAEILLDKGGNPNTTYKDGRSLLYLACTVGNIDLVELLLKRGADVEGPTPWGPKPLGIAARMPETDFISVLLAHGANANAVTGNPGLNTTALIAAAHHGHSQNIELLLAHGASLKTADFFSRTALSHAAENGHIKAIQVLLEAGAEVDIPDLKGQTPLFWAVSGSHPRAVEVLIQGGAEVARGDKKGLTPISLAMRAGDEATIRVLYQYPSPISHSGPYA